jgi:hypothetical protein
MALKIHGTINIQPGSIEQASLAQGVGGGAGYDQTTNSTGYFPLASGTTQQRPQSPPLGAIRYNSTTGFAEVYTAAGWGIFGALPPSISSISPVTYNGESGTVFTINGSNFTNDATVKFITSGNTEYNATIVQFINSTQLTASTPQDFTVADEPLDVKVSQASGTVTATDAIDCGGVPSWSTAAGTLATINDEGGSYSPIATVTATDPDTNSTVTYSISTGSLPAGTTLDSSTGAISGNPTNVNSQTTSNFSIAATDNAGNISTRSFSIIVNPSLDGTTSARAGTSAQAIKTLTGTTTSGKYWVTINGVAKEIYCDMANDGGGWMLYSSFSTASEFASSANYPAINGNGILHSQHATYGYSTYLTNYHDGVTNNLGLGWSGSGYAFFYNAGTEGYLNMDTWYGPTTGITQLRAKYGSGNSSGDGTTGGCRILLNNGTVTLPSRGSLTGSISSGNFNPQGTTPLCRVIEESVASISWIMIK